MSKVERLNRSIREKLTVDAEVYGLFRESEIWGTAKAPAYCWGDYSQTIESLCGRALDLLVEWVRSCNFTPEESRHIHDNLSKAALDKLVLEPVPEPYFILDTDGMVQKIVGEDRNGLIVESGTERRRIRLSRKRVAGRLCEPQKAAWLLRREFSGDTDHNVIVEKIKQQIRANREASGSIFVRAELTELLSVIDLIEEQA
jgi:hypothetical protein